MQPKNTSLVPNTTIVVDFGLNLLATGSVEQTIRISVVMSPVNFSFFNRVLLLISIINYLKIDIINIINTLKINIAIYPYQRIV